MRGDLGEGAVRGSEDSVVRGGAVESFDKVGIVGDEGGELGGVLGARNEFEDGLVGFAVMGWVFRLAVVRAGEDISFFYGLSGFFKAIEPRLLLTVEEILGFLARLYGSVKCVVNG